MQEHTDDILAAELKKLAIKATTKETGTEAVSSVAKQLPNDTATIDFQLQADPEAVLRAAYAVLRDEGRIEERLESNSETASVSGVIGSGFLGLNPAIVTVHVVPLDSEHVDVTVTGVAREGLIEQRGGEKAVEKIADLLKCRMG